jgi:hypothetical protein
MYERVIHLLNKGASHYWMADKRVQEQLSMLLEESENKYHEFEDIEDISDSDSAGLLMSV